MNKNSKKKKKKRKNQKGKKNKTKISIIPTLLYKIKQTINSDPAVLFLKETILIKKESIGTFKIANFDEGRCGLRPGLIPYLCTIN